MLELLSVAILISEISKILFRNSQHWHDCFEFLANNMKNYPNIIMTIQFSGPVAQVNDLDKC